MLNMFNDRTPWEVAYGCSINVLSVLTPVHPFQHLSIHEFVSVLGIHRCVLVLFLKLCIENENMTLEEANNFPS